MVDKGNPSSVTDAGVGALCARAAVHGAYMNVKVNTGDLDDKSYVEKVLADGQKMTDAADKMEAEVRDLVHQRIS